MMPFALTGVLIGTLVATRFSVLALIPTMACALAIAAVTSLLGRGVTAGAVIALLLGLQLGYVAAAGACFALAARRSRSAAPFGRPRTH